MFFVTIRNICNAYRPINVVVVVVVVVVFVVVVYVKTCYFDIVPLKMH